MILPRVRGKPGGFTCGVRARAERNDRKPTIFALADLLTFSNPVTGVVVTHAVVTKRRRTNFRFETTAI